MEQNTMQLIWQGFANIWAPYHIFLMVAGVTGGIVAGALPGIGPALAIALLIPFSLVMGTMPGMVLLGAIWCGCTYGGSITATLFKVPGTPASMATTFDAYPMTEKGEGDIALTTCLVSSVIGGIVGAALLLWLFVPLSEVALRFSKPEYFWLCVFGLTAVSSVSGKNIRMGIMSVLLGLAIRMLGMDPTYGMPRFTGGNITLMQGVDLVSALVGIFAFSQVLEMSSLGAASGVNYTQRKSGELIRTTLGRMFSRCKATIVRSAIIGTIVGILPGTGTSIASIISYNEAMRWSKTPETFGKGEIEGVVASETANNAVIGGSCIPMMALAIPGCPAAAVIMGAFMSHGIVPGSKLLVESGELAFTFIWVLIMVNLFMLVIGFYMGRPIAKTVQLPPWYIAPTILLLCSIGTYSVRNSLFDIYVMVGLGLFTFFGRKVGIAPAPLALGMVLGPITEEALNAALVMAQASESLWRTMIARPICLVLIGLTLLSLLTPLMIRKKSSRAAVPQPGGC